MSKRSFIGVFAVCALLAATFVAWRVLHRAQSAPSPSPLVVKTSKVSRHSVADFLETSGKVMASQTAEVRPQANGVLRAVLIEDGQRVERGQVLFSIDPHPLDAAVAQARATYAHDAALATDAEQTEQRLRPLVGKHYVSAQDYQNARNSMLSLQAAAKASKALIDEAIISRGYAQVRAPIAGRIGAVLVKAGNLVSASQSTPLVVINAATAVDVGFSVPQSQVHRLRSARDASDDGLDVVALDAETGEERGRGKLTFIDNAIDDASGTLAMRSRFSNSDEALWPGEFVTVRVVLAVDPDALTVPESALQQGQQGTYVYCLRSGKARVQPITVVRRVESQAVVAKGLAVGDEVVLAVPNTLRDGADAEAEDEAKTPAAALPDGGAGANGAETIVPPARTNPAAKSASTGDGR